MVFEVVGPLLRAEQFFAYPFFKLNDGTGVACILLRWDNHRPSYGQGREKCLTLNNGPIDLGMVHVYI